MDGWTVHGNSTSHVVYRVGKIASNLNLVEKVVMPVYPVQNTRMQFEAGLRFPLLVIKPPGRQLISRQRLIQHLGSQ